MSSAKPIIDPFGIVDSVMGGGDEQPNLTTYGGGMKEALETQLALLTGKKVGAADFSDVGSLESLLPIEQSLRKKSAQVDTDVLRTTLLGGQTGGGQQEVTYDDQGRAISGYTEPGEAKIRTVVEDSDGNVIPNAGDPNVVSDAQRVRVEFVDANGNVIDQSDDLPITSKILERFSDGSLVEGPLQTRLSSTLTNLTDQLISNLENNPDFDQETLDKIKTERASIPGFDQRTMMGSESYDGYGLNKNQNSYAISEAQPIFAKDTEGNVITDVSKAGTTETTTLPTQRTGDGMIDLLGDSRSVQDTVARPDYEQYVRNNPEYMAEVARDNATREQQGLPPRSLAEWGEAHYARVGEAKGDTLPTSYDQSDTGRQAGFASAEDGGGFLGLSAYAEDLAAGNLSRQRERDLLDVARLSGTYQDIMDDYKPGTQQALSDAREVLASQKDNLTGAGAITVPTDSTFGGKVGGQTFDAATMGDAINLQAGTTYDPSLVSEKGLGYEAVAGLQGGQLLQNDPVRAALMKDAEAALGQGLTDREQRQIAEAARARSTMMGRTFDQSGAIAEAEARVAEDNQRRMQNRAFAQSALGQEAGFQESDLGRALQAGIQNQAAQNRAGEFTAGQTLASRMANQAASNQASQFGVQAGMGQEQSEAQMNQARLMANQQAQQQASAFGAESAQQGAIQDARNLQQANQFQQSISADAQRLNEQLRQQGTLGYIQAASNLAALEDRSTLDPFQAVLGRGGGQSLSSGQSVLGTAGYGLGSGPQFINPESGLGFIQNQNTNLMNMFNAQTQADAERFSGLTSAAATAALAACWVAREVYGVDNPAWVSFRYWMLNESPSWFRATYLKYGERFARFISDKPRLKARIRTWMDSKIGR